MDVGLGWLAALISLHDRHKFPTCIPATGGLFLPTSGNCKVQLSHNDF